MMDTLCVMFDLVVASILVYGLGHSFIDRVFDRQEEFMNKLTEKGNV